MTVKTIGPFSAGEIPAPLTITFQDSTGEAIDIGGFDAQWVVKNFSTDEETTSEAAVDGDGTEGKATYTFADGDLDTAGRYVGQMWVDDGTVRYASEPFHFKVEAHTTSPFPVSA